MVSITPKSTDERHPAGVGRKRCRVGAGPEPRVSPHMMRAQTTNRPGRVCVEPCCASATALARSSAGRLHNERSPPRPLTYVRAPVPLRASARTLSNTSNDGTTPRPHTPGLPMSGWHPKLHNLFHKPKEQHPPLTMASPDMLSEQWPAQRTSKCGTHRFLLQRCLSASAPRRDFSN